MRRAVGSAARKIGRDEDGFAVPAVLPHGGRAWEVTVGPRAALPLWAGRGLSVLVVLVWALVALRGRRIAAG